LASKLLQQTTADKGAQNAAAQGGLCLGDGIRVDTTCRVEDDARLGSLKHPIDHADMEVHMLIEAGAETVDEGDCANVQRSPVYTCRTGAVGLQILCDHPQKNPQHHVEHCPITLHEVTQTLWHRQHPLAHRQAGKDVIRQVCRRLHHASHVARGAHTTALAGIGHKIVVPAVITPGAGKAVGKNAAFEVFAKRLAHIGLGSAVVALPIELTCTGHLQPGLKVVGYGFVKQRTLRVAPVVEFGLAVGLCCGGVHRAMPTGHGPQGNTVFMNSIYSNPLPRQSPAAL
jgi:hypothetical protein